MDDYAMGLFLAARRKILSLEPGEPACLCIALSDVLFDDGGDYISNKEMPKLFPAFAATYDGNHFWQGNLVEEDEEEDYRSDTGISACWWYPAEAAIPRIAMIDFLVGK